jgi:hypothetical protein
LNKEELDIIDCDRYIYENKEQFLEFIKRLGTSGGGIIQEFAGNRRKNYFMVFAVIESTCCPTVW